MIMVISITFISRRNSRDTKIFVGQKNEVIKGKG